MQAYVVVPKAHALMSAYSWIRVPLEPSWPSGFAISAFAYLTGTTGQD